MQGRSCIFTLDHVVLCSTTDGIAGEALMCHISEYDQRQFSRNFLDLFQDRFGVLFSGHVEIEKNEIPGSLFDHPACLVEALSPAELKIATVRGR